MHNLILNILAPLLFCDFGLIMLLVFSKNKPTKPYLEDFEEFWHVDTK